MIIVRIFGGLGNQLFQYAAARRFSILNATNLKLDLSFISNAKNQFDYLLNHFNIVEDVASYQETLKFLLPRIKNRYIYHFANLFYPHRNVVKQNMKVAIDDRLFLKNQNSFLLGYWQSYKYFEDIREILLKDFTLKDESAISNSVLLSQVSALNSVGMHVRRGDFIGNPIHEVCSLNYYYKAIEYLESRMSIDKIFVFSDDVEWCKTNIKTEHNIKFIEDEIFTKNPHNSLVLLSKCNNLILSNSSFSWWAAWLNKNQNNIICPSRWYNLSSTKYTDFLIPDNWIKIGTE